ncbi:ATP-grasp domain-containing protein [Aeromonas sobria]|uniref:ATP-grasp domain-containing protein n=1 Tax=Aeromonas sobria TaxID=646 RepID=UPI0012FF060C|nr:hypothetical protein [Aeromonas sobria]
MKKKVFLLHGRVGKSILIDFDYISKFEGMDIYLVTNKQVSYWLDANGIAKFFSKIICCDNDTCFESITSEITSNIDIGTTDFYIVTLSESRVELCGRLNNHFGLNSIDYNLFVNKRWMKENISPLGICTPKFIVIDFDRYRKSKEHYINNIIKEIGLPIFIKPLNMFGAMETSKINSNSELESWFNDNKNSSLTFEADEFLDGELFHCESITINGEVKLCHVFKYSTPCFNTYLGENLGSISLLSSEPDFIKISHMSSIITHEFLKSGSGVTHLEVFKVRGQYYFLEIAYRPPGILASDVYLKLYKLPLREWHILSQVGFSFDTPELNFHVARLLIPYPIKPGRLEGISKPRILSKYKFNWNCEIGDNLPVNQGIDEYAGTMLIWNKDLQQLKSDFKAICQHDFLTVI